MTAYNVPSLETLMNAANGGHPRDEFTDRNASLPDATGYSAPYSGDPGFYTDIVRGEIPDGLLRI
jgi:hypothetical protein